MTNIGTYQDTPCYTLSLQEYNRIQKRNNIIYIIEEPEPPYKFGKIQSQKWAMIQIVNNTEWLIGYFNGKSIDKITPRIYNSSAVAVSDPSTSSSLNEPTKTTSPKADPTIETAINFSDYSTVVDTFFVNLN